MKKWKQYENVRFTAEVIVKAVAALRESFAPDELDKARFSALTAKVGDVEWSLDTIEELLAEHRDTNSETVVSYYIADAHLHIESCIWTLPVARVSVSAKSRQSIERVFAVFEDNVLSCTLAEPPKKERDFTPTIFIGHGHSPAWRDLKDHLTEKHYQKVEAYEIGARAGHAVRNILDDMLSKSSIAFLVMTGDDETSEGNFRARQNVVHEIGLFQGRLGFGRGIVLLEDGVEEFSNIKGIEQIRFTKGGIRETFGDVLATIRREFP